MLVAILYQLALGGATESRLWTLASQSDKPESQNAAFEEAYGDYHRNFDFTAYSNLRNDFEAGLLELEKGNVYRNVASQPHCDLNDQKPKHVAALEATHIAAL